MSVYNPMNQSTGRSGALNLLGQLGKLKRPEESQTPTAPSQPMGAPPATTLPPSPPQNTVRPVALPQTPALLARPQVPHNAPPLPPLQAQPPVGQPAPPAPLQANGLPKPEVPKNAPPLPPTTAPFPHVTPPDIRGNPPPPYTGPTPGPQDNPYDVLLGDVTTDPGMVNGLDWKAQMDQAFGGLGAQRDAALADIDAQTALGERRGMNLNAAMGRAGGGGLAGLEAQTLLGGMQQRQRTMADFAGREGALREAYAGRMQQSAEAYKDRSMQAQQQNLQSKMFELDKRWQEAERNKDRTLQAALQKEMEATALQMSYIEGVMGLDPGTAQYLGGTISTLNPDKKDVAAGGGGTGAQMVNGVWTYQDANGSSWYFDENSGEWTQKQPTNNESPGDSNHGNRK